MKDRSAEFFSKVQRTTEIGGREGVLFRVWKRHSGTAIYWMTEVQRRSDGGSDTCAAFEPGAAYCKGSVLYHTSLGGASKCSRSKRGGGIK